VNRELALLRHRLRLAEEWGYITRAPRIRIGREDEGRLRFLTEDEAARLLEACARSRSRFLITIVTVALYTGARRGEVLGLTWERVDFSRGVMLFDKTKNGRRREVPMNQAAYRAVGAHGLEGGRQLPVPRSAPHGRVLARHGGPESEGSAGAARPPVAGNDDARRPPEPGPAPPGGRRVARRRDSAQRQHTAL
jgi:integrase